MKKFQRFFAIALCVILLPLAGICSASAEETVTWWTWSTEATVAYTKMVELFNEKYPDIRVDLQFISNNDYWTKLPVAIASGTGPDVYQMTRPSFELYAASKQAMDLTDMIAASPVLQENMAQMDPTLIDTYQFGGVQMAIPYTVEATAIAYNKTLFEKAGLPDLKEIESTWTWQDLFDLATKLTEKDASGNTTQYGFLVGADRIPSWELIWAHGYEMFDETGATCMIGQEGIAEALQILVDRYAAGVSPSTEATATMSSDDMFMSGKIAMIAAGIWKIPTFRGIDAFEWDVVELPFDAATGKRVSSSNVLGFVVNPNAKSMDATARFLEVLTSPEGQAILADNQIYIPANVNVRDSYFAMDKPANILAYQRTLSYLHPNTLTQFIPYSQFTKEFTDALREAYSGSKTALQALQDHQASIQAIMDENKETFN